MWWCLLFSLLSSDSSVCHCSLRAFVLWNPYCASPEASTGTTTTNSNIISGADGTSRASKEEDEVLTEDEALREVLPGVCQLLCQLLCFQGYISYGTVVIYACFVRYDLCLYAC